MLTLAATVVLVGMNAPLDERFALKCNLVMGRGQRTELYVVDIPNNQVHNRTVSVDGIPRDDSITEVKITDDKIIFNEIFVDKNYSISISRWSGGIVVKEASSSSRYTSGTCEKTDMPSLLQRKF